MRNIYILFLCLFALNLAAANFENLPTEVVQPDGSVLSLFASGDEYANWLHDAAGYTIIQSPSDGYYYYATSQNGEPVPSAWRADSSDPSALGLRPGINISPEKYRQKVQLMNDHPRRGARGPNTGTVNNLVVYIRFADQTEFTEPRSVYDAKFNADGDQDNSLRNYFHLVSYDQLNYVSHHFPTCAPDINLSYQDSHPRAYYLPYNAVTNPQGYRDWQRTDREHALLAAAIAGIASQVPTDLNIDADEDGYVDNVCFIIRGPHTAWNDLLWAHRWALYTVDSYINNKMVWDFTFQPEDQNTVRTLCHEMFHSAGAPDLYHYNFDGMTPAGCWDIMESGYGHMGMYMKFRYGNWISTIPTVTSGTYILNPVTSATNNAIKYQLTASEFLVFEYRKQGSDLFEESLPGSGLLIYRINSTQDGNSQGPPDEVYVYRPDGTNSNNGSLSEATFSEGNYCTEFNQYTNPSCFLTNGTNTPVNVHGIGEAGDTIAFTISAPAGSYPPVISHLSPADVDFACDTQRDGAAGIVEDPDEHVRNRKPDRNRVPFVRPEPVDRRPDGPFGRTVFIIKFCIWNNGMMGFSDGCRAGLSRHHGRGQRRQGACRGRCEQGLVQRGERQQVGRLPVGYQPCEGIDVLVVTVGREDQRAAVGQRPEGSRHGAVERE